MRYASCRAGACSCGADIQGNEASVILNVGCIGCQRHDACATSRRWALIITMISAVVAMARHCRAG